LIPQNPIQQQKDGKSGKGKKDDGYQDTDFDHPGPDSTFLIPS
jgi:hypothetical protein